MEACLDPTTMDPNICPAGVPPPGIVPMDPLAKGYSTHGMCVTTAITIAVVVPAVAVRIFTKGYILKRLQIEDCRSSISLRGVIRRADLCRLFAGCSCKMFPDLKVTNLTHEKAGCIAISGVMGYAYSTFRIGRHQWDTSVADFVQTLRVRIYCPTVLNP